MKIHLNIILLSTSWSPQWLPHPCAHLYPTPYAPHALPISFILILPPAQLLEHINNNNNNNILVKKEFHFMSKLSKEAASYDLISDILNTLNNKNIIGKIM
jgi:hypothetical protein